MSHFNNDDAITRADIAGLRFALGCQAYDDIDARFLSFHHWATHSIRRSQIQTLECIEPVRLCDVVQKWGALYEKYFRFLLERHSDQVCAVPAETAVTLENLGLTPIGLACLSIASRYAECWAESAIHNDVSYDQWKERFDYIGSDEFVCLHNLREYDELLAYDHRGLALPVFDIALIAKYSSEPDLWRAFASNRSHLVRLSERSARTIAQLYAKSVFHPGEIRALFAKAKGRFVRSLSAVNFESARAGVLSQGYVFLDATPEIYFLDECNINSAFFIMESLRSNAEFTRLVFHESIADAALAVFPNQQVRPLPSDDSDACEKSILKSVNQADGRPRVHTDYRHLDEWFFRGEDHSYRSSGIAQ